METETSCSVSENYEQVYQVWVENGALNEAGQQGTHERHEVIEELTIIDRPEDEVKAKPESPNLQPSQKLEESLIPIQEDEASHAGQCCDDMGQAEQLIKIDHGKMDEQDAAKVVAEFQMMKELTCPHRIGEQPDLIVLDASTPTSFCSTPATNFSQQPPPRSFSSLAEDKQFCSLIQVLEAKVDQSLELVSDSLKDEFNCFQKMVDEVSAAHLALTEEMTAKAQLLKEVLQLAKKIPDPAKANRLLDRLEVTFSMASNQHWLAKEVKPKLMANAKQRLMDYVKITYGGISRVRSLVAMYSDDGPARQSDPYLVQVMGVVDPGEFYVTRWCDVEERTSLIAELKAIAPTCPLADPILLGRTYAILYNNNWHRGVAGQQSGFYMAGKEPIYDFFLPDLGKREQIPSQSVRTLPKDLADRPPMTTQCTLNANFHPRAQWDAQATRLFKELVARSPMDMTVFGVKDGILNVDLAQIPLFGEESHVLSVRDTLMLSCKPPVVPKDPPGKKYKPRFSQPLLQSSESPRHLSVLVSCCLSNPTNTAYVLEEDAEKLDKFFLMVEELQAEFRDANRQSPTYSASPRAGNAYVFKFGDEWSRVLLEETGYGTQQLFYVDTGHREEFNSSMELHRMPDKFFELPAQAVRCVLNGVCLPGAGKELSHDHWEISNFMGQLENKPAVIFVEWWTPGNVGYPTKASPDELTANVVLYLVDLDGQEKLPPKVSNKKKKRKKKEKRRQMANVQVVQ